MAENESTSEADARLIYEQVKAQPAVITKAQMRSLEDDFQADTWGVTRRIGLAMLTKPCAPVFAEAEAGRGA